MRIYKRGGSENKERGRVIHDLHSENILLLSPMGSIERIGK